MRKYNETILATTNTVYFKQEFLSIGNMTFKLGPANGIPLALTFWLMCFKSHLSHLVKHHSYGRLATVRQNLTLTWSSDFVLTFMISFIFTSHMLYVDLPLQLQLTYTD